MTIADTATKPEWMAIMSQLKEVDGALQFWIGDGLRFGIQKLYIARDRYDEAEAITGLDRQTLRDDAWVAGEVDPSMRRADLSYQHHKAVAPLEPKEQKKWLDMAEKEGLGYRQLREAIRVAYPLPYPEREPFGSFYVIATVPDIDSHRIKLGFTEDKDRRLRELLTVSSTAKLIHSWPCRRSWELSIITLLTAQDCVQL